MLKDVHAPISASKFYPWPFSFLFSYMSSELPDHWARCPSSSPVSRSASSLPACTSCAPCRPGTRSYECSISSPARTFRPAPTASKAALVWGHWLTRSVSAWHTPSPPWRNTSAGSSSPSSSPWAPFSSAPSLPPCWLWSRERPGKTFYWAPWRYRHEQPCPWKQHNQAIFNLNCNCTYLNTFSRSQKEVFKNIQSCLGCLENCLKVEY